MSDRLCVLCAKTLYGRGIYDKELPDGDPRRGPYHVNCYFERRRVTGAGEYQVEVGRIYGMPVLLTARHYGILPERFAVWAADKLIRLAFRLLGQRARFKNSGDYFNAMLLREPWATSWMSAKEPKEKARL